MHQPHRCLPSPKMNSFYVVLDVLDDQLYGKINRSDAILFAQLGALTSHGRNHKPFYCCSHVLPFPAWALLWILIALIITSLGIIAGAKYDAMSLFFFSYQSKVYTFSMRTPTHNGWRKHISCPHEELTHNMIFVKNTISMNLSCMRMGLDVF